MRKEKERMHEHTLFAGGRVRRKYGYGGVLARAAWQRVAPSLVFVSLSLLLVVCGSGNYDWDAANGKPNGCARE